MPRGHTRQNAPSPRKGGDGDAPADEANPRIFGEEIQDHRCEPDFIAGPPPQCTKQKNEVPSFRGDFCYIVFPGSAWETNGPGRALSEAQSFFQKYCMYFNFIERTLVPDRENEYEGWYAEWRAAVRRSIVPDRHVPGLRRRIAAQNPGGSPSEIDVLVERQIREILRAATIPHHLHDRFFAKMRELQAEVAGNDCSHTLIVFVDEYVCYNPKPTRASACQLSFNQIGITAADIGSRNVLAHEMVHLLGKPQPNRGGKVTWEHEKCPDSVLHVTRSDWWVRADFADFLSSDAYQEIIRNQEDSPVRLIRRTN